MIVIVITTTQRNGDSKDNNIKNNKIEITTIAAVPGTPTPTLTPTPTITITMGGQGHLKIMSNGITLRGNLHSRCLPCGVWRQDDVLDFSLSIHQTIDKIRCIRDDNDNDDDDKDTDNNKDATATIAIDIDNTFDGNDATTTATATAAVILFHPVTTTSSLVVGPRRILRNIQTKN